MPIHSVAPGALTPGAAAFYRHALTALSDSRVPFLLGGAYAFAQFTGIERHTKDLDVIVHPDDVSRVLSVLQNAGYATEIPFPHWLAKARCGEDYIDVIYSSGNGVARVDDEWFDHSRDGQAFGVPLKLIPREEMIWSKAFVVERERYDGADVIHLVRCAGKELDWQRLLRRFGDRWRVLMAHLVFFGFVYPGARDCVPKWVLDDLTARLLDDHAAPHPDDVCQGTLLSRQQYLVDVDQWGYEDARHRLPDEHMSADDIALWTAAIAPDFALEPERGGPIAARGGR